MANTYTQIYIHVIFAVKSRGNLVNKRWKEELFKYITGIVRTKGQKLIAINGMPDHIHIFLGMKPDMSLSDIVRDIKANSTNFINKKKFTWTKFSWQEGFGAFSCSQSHLDRVVSYIMI
jgi:REP element-mobilizing transposase RayT